MEKTLFYQPTKHYIIEDGNESTEQIEDLYSFQVFYTKADAINWLVNHGYNPAECVIETYTLDDIENPTVIDADDNVVMIYGDSDE